VANFVIESIVVAHITLCSWKKALVRLKLRIVPIAHFGHSVLLLSGPIWYLLDHTTGVGVLILPSSCGVDLMKWSYYLSNIGSCARPLCVEYYRMQTDFT